MNTREALTEDTISSRLVVVLFCSSPLCPEGGATNVVVIPMVCGFTCFLFYCILNFFCKLVFTSSVAVQFSMSFQITGETAASFGLTWNVCVLSLCRIEDIAFIDE